MRHEPSPAVWSRVERFPLCGVAVHVRSLYNVGAMFRASDAARVQHLYLTGGCGQPARDRPKIDKTALGAIDSVAWTWALDPLPVLDSLRHQGVRLVALELTPTAQPLSAVTRDWFPLALVVGHETDGVPAEVLARCDDTLQVTTYGRKPSLNVALAYGLAVVQLAQVWAGG